jgi:hypothetical protein
MPWRSITTTEAEEEFTPAEKAAIDVATQGALFSSVLGRVVDFIRSACLAGSGAVGEAPTIPDLLRMDAVAVARWRWLCSIPSLKALQSEDRKALHDDGIKRIEKVATGDLKVETPTTAGTETLSSGNSELVSYSTRPTGDTLSGL